MDTQESPVSVASQTKLLLSLNEVADLLGVSANTVKNRIRSGALVSVKEGGLRKVRPADLQRYVDALTDGTETAAPAA